MKPEVCNTLDDDCNGEIDNGIEWQGIPLGDACDGIGACGNGTVECSLQDTVATCSSNPDGTDPQDTPEVCDTVDNDCDTELNEGQFWQGIALGDQCDGIGQCGIGVVECAADTTATCSTNDDGSDPGNTLEVCDFADNDCNGAVDENHTYEGIPLGQPCDGIGVCGNGTVTCAQTGAAVATCSTNPNGPNALSTDEVCDTLDNDCNGEPDDGLQWQGVDLGDTCDGIGECGEGTVVCNAAEVATCSTNADGPDDNLTEDEEEICDNKDNDCNGETDNDITNDTTGADAVCNFTGVCNKTNITYQCQPGGVEVCIPPAPGNDFGYKNPEETCDGKDNDCDGETDEPTTVIAVGDDLCDLTVGVCTGMEPTCDGPLGWVCHYDLIAAYSVTEGATQCDDKDNDCDGVTDESFTDKGNACTRGVGQCQLTGTLICNGSNNGLVCSVTGAELGTTCDDGDACTHTDDCSGGDNSDCAGVSYSCIPDGLACTDDNCSGDGNCTFDLQAGKCNIGNKCYDAQALNPSNDCQWCDPTKDTADWSLRPNGAQCDDLNACTVSDACNASGECKGTGKDCGDGLDCTIDACSNDVCDNSGLKVGTCLIAGVCYNDGAEQIIGGCKTCQPSVSQSVWSDKQDGLSCDDAQKCTQFDECKVGVCVGEQNACNDSNECTADSCDNGAAGNGCVNAALDAAPCDDDGNACTNNVCSGSTCTHPIKTDGCLIAGACYSNNQVNPDNQCQLCVNATAPAAWTNKGNGITCNDANECTKDDVCDGSGGCAGVALADEDCDDGNDCTFDFCPGAAGCQYLKVPDTTACPNNADALTCTIDQCLDGVCDSATVKSDACLISGGCVDENTEDPGNQCASCQPGVNQAAYENKANATLCNNDSTGCTKDDACVDGSCIAGSAVDCSSLTDQCNTGTCFSTADNTSECQAVAKPASTTCTTDSLPCTEETCVAGSCSALEITAGCVINNNLCVQAGAVDPASECRTCQPSVSKTTYSPKAELTPCTDDGNPCTTNTCNAQGVCAHPAKADNTACTNDGKDCTDDVCSSGSCVNNLQSGKCLISGACYDSGDANPAKECEACNPALNAFLPKGVTAPCTPDANPCTDDHCDGAGNCVNTNSFINTPCDIDSLTCTTQKCDGFGNCDATTNDGTCLIGGTTCVNVGAEDPATVCKTCQATDKTQYTNVANPDNKDCDICGKCVDGGCAADLSQDTDCNSCGSCGGLGTCDADGKGTSGDGTCGSYVCDGSNLPCPTTCVDDTFCNGTTWCQGTSCVAKKADGAACSGNNNECTSGFCTDGVCCDASCGGDCEACNGAGACLPHGSTEDPESDCGSFLCSGTSGCDTTCAVDVDCKTGNWCNGAACEPLKANGQACGGNNECVNTCISSLCANPSSTNGACDATDDCTANHTCSGGQCLLDNGEGCTANSECLNTCIGSVCAVTSVTNGPCEETADCDPAHTCSGGQCLLNNGQTCSANSECVNTCICSACAAVSGTNGACDATDDCAANHTCSGGQCLLDDGQACSANTECVNTCISSSCAAVSGTNGACDATDDCAANQT